MNDYVLATFTIFLASASCALAQPQDELETKLRKKIPSLQATYQVPGVAIAIVEDGRTPKVLNFGLRNAGTEERVTDETLFEVASISKLVTAAAVLKLVDEDRIDLLNPVEDYLERFHFADSEWKTSGVTIKRILNHTAGLSVHGYFPGSIIPGAVPGILDSVTGSQDAEERVEVVASPGSGYRYSGGGYSVLQIALEDTFDTPFAILIDQLLFSPIGLKRTSFEVNSILSDDAAHPHDIFSSVLPQRSFANVAAGGLTTTAGELAKLVQAIFASISGRTGVLSRSAAQLLATPSADGTEVRETPSLEQTMVAPESFPDPNAMRPSLGAIVATRQDGRRFVGHSGSNVGWKAIVEYVPETGDGIVVLTNSESGYGIILPAVCEWRRNVDRSMGATVADTCPEFGVALLQARFGKMGIESAVEALREMKLAPVGTYLFDDWTAIGFVISLFEQESLGRISHADVIAASRCVLEENTSLYPNSSLATSAHALILALAGDRIAAEAEIVRAKRQMPISNEAQGFIEQVEHLGE